MHPREAATSTFSSLKLDRVEELLLLRRHGARAITWYDGETMVGFRCDDMCDLLARGGNAGHTGLQHSLLPCNRRVGGDHQLLRQCGGTVELGLEGAAQSRPAQPARQADGRVEGSKKTRQPFPWFR